MYKSFKFRLYPNKEQTQLLNKSFGCSRFVYNHYLSNIKNNSYQNAYSNISDYVNNLKYEYLFFGYPRYKSKFDRNGYITGAIYSNYKNKRYCNIELDLVNRLIKLSKLKCI